MIITGWLLVYALLASLKLPNLHAVAQTVLGKPLGLLGNNLFGLMILVALNSSFWFVGLHGGNVVNAVMKPLWLSNLDANKVAYQAGKNYRISLPVSLWIISSSLAVAAQLLAWY